VIVIDYWLIFIRTQRKISGSNAYRKEIYIALCFLIASHVISDMLRNSNSFWHIYKKKVTGRMRKTTLSVAQTSNPIPLVFAIQQNLNGLMALYADGRVRGGNPKITGI
jgi:hypothetical protein